MIVTCPGCASKYRVANEAVPADGARMRCPKCETLFLAKPPVGADVADHVSTAPTAALRPGPGAGLPGPGGAPSPFGVAGSPTSPPTGAFGAPSPFGVAGAAPSPLGNSLPPSPFGVAGAAASPFGSAAAAPLPAQSGLGFGPAPSAPSTGGPLTAMMRTLDASSLPSSSSSSSSSLPPRPAPAGDDDPFARINLDARPDPGLHVPTMERMSLPPRPAPPPVQPRPSSSYVAPATLARPATQRQPASMLLTAASWVFLAVGAVSAVGGVVFAAWTSEAIDLDARLMPVVERSLGVHPPFSFVGADDVPVDALRREAMARESAGDLPAAVVLWRRVLARDADDATAKTALPRVMMALGERRR
jgi:predicted Zn finger-like uncharacterized protein